MPQWQHAHGDNDLLQLPDKAIEPKRLRTVLMVLVLGLIVWGVLSLVVSSVREHTE